MVKTRRFGPEYGPCPCSPCPCSRWKRTPGCHAFAARREVDEGPSRRVPRKHATPDPLRSKQSGIKLCLRMAQNLISRTEAARRVQIALAEFGSQFPDIVV